MKEEISFWLLPLSFKCFWLKCLENFSMATLAQHWTKLVKSISTNQHNLSTSFSSVCFATRACRILQMYSGKSSLGFQLQIASICPPDIPAFALRVYTAVFWAIRSWVLNQSNLDVQLHSWDCSTLSKSMPHNFSILYQKSLVYMLSRLYFKI